MTLQVEIVSQDHLLYKGEADQVVLPGVEGEMGILPKHTPLITTLAYGILTVRHKGGEEVFTVAGGVAEVLPDEVIVLADAAENVAEIDEARAEAAKRRAEELLRKTPPSDVDAYQALEAALQRSKLRLGAVQRYRGARPKSSVDIDKD